MKTLFRTIDGDYIVLLSTGEIERLNASAGELSQKEAIPIDDDAIKIIVSLERLHRLKIIRAAKYGRIHYAYTEKAVHILSIEILELITSRQVNVYQIGNAGRAALKNAINEYRK